MTDLARAFTKRAEEILAESKLSGETAQRLRDWVDRVRSGKDVITSELSEQEIVVRCV